MNQNEQLAKLLENSEKQLFYSRIRSIAAVVTALCILCALVMVVPALLRTAAGADAVIAQASSSITLADEAITEMGLSMDDFIAENAEAVSSLMKEIEAIDFEGLNKAIKDLGDVVEPFAKFFNRFQ